MQFCKKQQGVCRVSANRQGHRTRRWLAGVCLASLLATGYWLLATPPCLCSPRRWMGSLAAKVERELSRLTCRRNKTLSRQHKHVLDDVVAAHSPHSPRRLDPGSALPIAICWPGTCISPTHNQHVRPVRGVPSSAPATRAIASAPNLLQLTRRNTHRERQSNLFTLLAKESRRGRIRARSTPSAPVPRRPAAAPCIADVW